MKIITCTSACKFYTDQNSQFKQKNQPNTNFKNLNLCEASCRNRIEQFTKKGYRLVSEDIDVVSPEGIIMKGAAFVKDRLNLFNRDSKYIDLVITDNNGMALGVVSSSPLHKNDSPNTLNCTIRNFTNKNNLINFMEPDFEAIKYDYAGKYRKVGTRLYDTLVKYLKENCPQYTELYVLVHSQESWDFHSKYGFTMYRNDKTPPTPDDYNPYCPSENFLFYNLK